MNSPKYNVTFYSSFSIYLLIFGAFETNMYKGDRKLERSVTEFTCKFHTCKHLLYYLFFQFHPHTRKFANLHDFHDIFVILSENHIDEIRTFHFSTLFVGFFYTSAHFVVVFVTRFLFLINTHFCRSFSVFVPTTFVWAGETFTWKDFKNQK